MWPFECGFEANVATSILVIVVRWLGYGTILRRYHLGT